MVLSDGTTSSLLELFAELNPDKKVELSRFVNGKIDFSYRFFYLPCSSLLSMTGERILLNWWSNPFIG